MFSSGATSWMGVSRESWNGKASGVVMAFTGGAASPATTASSAHAWFTHAITASVIIHVFMWFLWLCSPTPPWLLRWTRCAMAAGKASRGEPGMTGYFAKSSGLSR